MFSQLQFVRLRAAEKALREERFEEALRLATSEDLRAHRRAGAVRAALAKRFLERARAHYRADRFAEALADLEFAERAGAAGDEIDELRRNVQVVAHEVRRQNQSRREKIERARRRIEQGSLVAGRRLLEEAPSGNPEVAKMKREASLRAEDADQLIRAAERDINEGRLKDAMERLGRAERLDRHHDRIAALRTELCRRVLHKVRTFVLEGRLARASDELAMLGPLGAEMAERGELADALCAAREASAALAEARFGDARRHILTLQRLVPQATWVNAALDAVRNLDELYTGLVSGPLGDRLGRRAGADRKKGLMGIGRTPFTPTDGAEGETLVLPGSADPGSDLSERLLLLVDGGGSYLILRAPRISVGRAASHRPADVPLLGDIGERHASIERVDEDYFLMSAKGAEIGGRRVHHALLRDGDRVVLGRKAKFTFRLPSRRSLTAVLALSDTTKAPYDVRCVVLFDRHATIGDGPTAHMHCRPAGPPLLLFERDGVLWVRQRNDGHVDAEPHRLTLGDSVEVGGVRLVLSEWKPTSGGVS